MEKIFVPHLYRIRKNLSKLKEEIDLYPEIKDEEYINKAISFDKPSFYALDTQNYKIAMDTINERDTKVTTSKNKVFTDYSSHTNASLFFTIPYDNGWTETVNNKKVKIHRAQKGFMKVDVPSGKGKVVLTFIPYGLKIGLIISCLAFGIFCCYAYFIGKIKITQKATRTK